MPSLLLNDVTLNSPSALMAIDLDSPKRALTRIEDESPILTPGEPTSLPVAAMRLKPAPARPKSYVQLLEEFQEQEALPTPSPRASRFSERSTMDETHGPLDERDEEAPADSSGPEHELPAAVARTQSSPPVTPRREDTARRHKRFSLPAVALQTSPITARPHSEGKGYHRFSLVLGRSVGATAKDREREDVSPGRLRHSLVAGRLNELLGRGKD